MKEYSKGSVRFHHGSWQGRISWKDDNGEWKQTRKSLKEFTSITADGRSIKKPIATPTDKRPNQGKKDAEKALEEWRESLIEKAKADEARKLQAEMGALSENVLGLNADTYIYDYVKTYIDTRKLKTKNNPSGVTKSTKSGYLAMLPSLKCPFEKIAMCDLKPAHIKAWQKIMEEKGRAGATINKAYFLLKGACEFAVANGDLDQLVFVNCFPAKRKDAPKAARSDPNPLDEDSFVLLNMLIARSNASDEFSTFMVAVQLALLAGLRRGEICGLRWRDIDFVGNKQFPNGYLKIETPLATASNEVYEDDPKTYAGIRTIPLNDDLKNVLMKCREDQLKAIQLMDENVIKATSVPPDDYFVIGDENGKFFDTRKLTKSWAAFAEGNTLMGIKKRRCTFHDLRHTFATRAIQEGIDVVVVSKILGHSRVSHTLDIYADAMPQGKVRGMEALNGVMLKKPRKADVIDIKKTGTDD